MASLREYGKTKEGQLVYAYTLKNKNGLQAEVINYGCIVSKLIVPDKKGEFKDITLGFDNLDDYIKRNSPYFGSVIGRVANRIEDAQFQLNGKLYLLYANMGAHHLHGGKKGFDKVVWDTEVIEKNGIKQLKFTYLSPDGEENYPGNLRVSVTYTLSDEDELCMDYEAEADADTPVNLTNHAYFNIAGHNSGNIDNHEVMINADFFTAADERQMTSGEILKVDGTPMDLRQPKVLSEGLESGYSQIVEGGGYDHNWVLNNNGDITKLACEVYEKQSGRVMEVYTTKPGVQLYTGNFLGDGTSHKDGAVYIKRAGLCLETQYFPNSIRFPHFPSIILKAGEKYSHTTIYKFGIR